MVSSAPSTPRLALISWVVLTSLLVGAPARAEDSDPWWGQDKALHFGVSAAIAGGGYGVGTLIFEQRSHAALFGGGLALAAGAAKEGADALGLGTPSVKDFVWDVAGALVGVALGLGIDLLVSSASRTSAPQRTGAP